MRKLILPLIILTLACMIVGIARADTGPNTLPAYVPYDFSGKTFELEPIKPFVQPTPQGAGTGSYSLEGIFDFSHHDVFAVVSKPIGHLTNVLKTKLTLDTFGFVGTSTKGIPAAGVGARSNFQLADEATAQVGLAGIQQQGAGWRLAIYGGFTYVVK